MYLFSPEKKAFYPAELRQNYIDAGTLPEDVIEVEDSVRDIYNSQPPSGKMLGVNNGLPAWVNIPPQPNSELLKVALTDLSAEYQADIEALNRAWLAAAVSDGVNETTKKNSVLSQITARKAKYATDRASLITQYPI